MKIALAILADYALAHEDGKLYVTGGGIRSLPFPAFPATQPHLAFALGLEVAPEELGMDHALGIDASGPTSDLVFKPVRVTFTVPRQTDPERSGYIHFVSNMDNVSFPAEGDYVFTVIVDGEKLESVVVRAELGGNVSEEVEASVLLMEGYKAFSQGETARAEVVFRQVVGRFPKVAGGYNNLGFVLLAKGDAEGALNALTEATKLGYPQSEISSANVACAFYLMGQPKTALELFQHCLRQEVFRGHATLFGINGGRLFPVVLPSAADYVALMQLNAAWSAWRAEERTVAARYREAASVAEVTRREDPGGQQFALSIEELGKVLTAAHR